jgi:hypothetical protein
VELQGISLGASGLLQALRGCEGPLGALEDHGGHKRLRVAVRGHGGHGGPWEIAKGHEGPQWGAGLVGGCGGS